jgi:hypothetical protein
VQCNRLSDCRTADVPADRPPQSRYPAILPRSGGDDTQFDRLKRREFIALIGSATAWPLAARAQESDKQPTIGFLGADVAGWRPWTDAFVARLRELGWIEGRTIAIEYRWTEGRPERVGEIAAFALPVCARADPIMPTWAAAMDIAAMPKSSGAHSRFARTCWTPPVDADR